MNLEEIKQLENLLRKFIEEFVQGNPDITDDAKWSYTHVSLWVGEEYRQMKRKIRNKPGIVKGGT